MHVALNLVFLLARLAAAGTATEAMKARDAEIRRALPPADHELTQAERSKLEGLLNRAVDLPAMAQSTLAERWDKLSEAQRKKFTSVFSEWFKKKSEGEIDFYRGTDIAYGSEKPRENGDVEVPTTLSVKDEPTAVIYVVRKEDSGFKIVDFSIDGISQVEDYQSSFSTVINKEGLDGLIQRLQKANPKPVGK